MRDVTLRVLEALAGCDLIACEDTRVTGKLLKHYGIKGKIATYNEHNANVSGPKLIQEIREGASVVLVSDAGTPLVSDPGFRLVAQARTAGQAVVPLPGASAPLAALAASELPCGTWTFAGFLPSKSGARVSRLESLAGIQSTLIFFESPNRLVKSLRDMIEVFGSERRGCIARELTKLHEEVTTGPLEELLRSYDKRTVKGEVVILVSPPVEKDSFDVKALLKELLQSMPVSKAAAEAALMTGMPKREVYSLALSLKDKK